MTTSLDFISTGDVYVAPDWARHLTTFKGEVHLARKPRHLARKPRYVPRYAWHDDLSRCYIYGRRTPLRGA
jgi:hypothetical protein